MQKKYRIKKHNDFVKAAQSGVYYRDNFLVAQCCKNQYDSYRAGFTASKKVGNAVVRNRCKRRLRAAATNILAKSGLNNCDYVFIARKIVFSCNWEDILNSITLAVNFLNKRI